MAGDVDTIKQFLVELGFKVNEAQLTKFSQSIGLSTGWVFKLAGAAVAAAGAIETFVTVVSAGMNKLYFMSQRIRSSVTTIQSFQLSMRELGIDTGTSTAMLERFAATLRQEPGKRGLLQSFGVLSQDTTEQIIGLVQKLKQQFGGSPFGYAAASQFAGQFGIDEQSFNQLWNNSDKLAKKNKLVADTYKAWGMNADDVAKKSHDFQNKLMEFEATASVAAASLNAMLLPVANWLTRPEVSASIGRMVTGVGTLVDKMSKGNFGTFTDTINSLVKASKDALPNLTKAFNFVVDNLIVPTLKTVTDAYSALLEAIAGNFSKSWDLVQKAVKESPMWRLFTWVGKQIAPSGTGGGAQTEMANPDQTKITASQQGSIKQAMDFFTKAGYSTANAAGIVANLFRESTGLKANAQGDKNLFTGKYDAYGIGQWHPDRQKEFAKWAGHDIKQSDFAEQLRFVLYELTQGTDKGARKAGTLLAGSTGAGDSARIIGKFFERHGGGEQEQSARAALATRLGAGQFSGGGTGQGGGPNVVIHQENKTTIHTQDKPEKISKASELAQRRVNADLVRHMKGATS